MKKLYAGVILVFFAVFNLLAVDVTISMNSSSPTMTLAPKEGGDPVEVGDPASYVYTFSADPGDYILTGYNGNGVATGTLEISIYEDGEQHDGGAQDGKIFRLTTVTAYASNSGWMIDEDYTMDCQAVGRNGDSRVITTTTGTITAGRKTFLMHVGDSYRLMFTAGEERIKEGYIGSFHHSATVTATVITNAAASIPLARQYSITVPADAELYVGWKWGAVLQSAGGTHYVPFVEVEPLGSSTSGGKTTYNFSLGNGCTYNYRVSQPGKLTNGGKFTMTADIAPMEITSQDQDLVSPKYINHDVTANSNANVADILMNINAEGHLKLKSGDSYQLVNLRIWQLTDNSTNNYFIEPDFYYRVIDLSGEESAAVVEVDENGLLTTKGPGTAIVQVAYDAINLMIYNSSVSETPVPYYYGSLWSAIWPENTGTFVVTVDQPETGIERNMLIQEGRREEEKSSAIDTEHDIFYYMQEEGGYTYTFAPVGVSLVSIANPVIETNISGYTGFQDVPANEDGSYTVFLTFGRNIIKLTDASGASEYQVISAKPVTYEVLNSTNPGEQLQPGDKATIQFSGFFHPASKLSGIYNQSGYIVYNDVPNGSSLILGAGQYTFAGNPEAQQVNIEIPSDWDTSEPFTLEKGALQINGFGSVIGKHRSISLFTGVNPNFTAVVHVDYYGSIPDVTIPVYNIDLYEVNFTGLPQNADLTVYDREMNVMEEAEPRKYNLTYGPYTYMVACPGYRAYRSEFSISSETEKTQEIEINLVAFDDNIAWDGNNVKQPDSVTTQESDTEGSQFQGMEGYYKISSGYELAWLAAEVNNGNNTISAVMTNDIDLADYDWTRIGNNTAAYQYKGIFDGGNYTVSGLYINTSTTYYGLFGYLNTAVIRNLTVEGVINSTANFAGGIIGGSTGATVVENCRNRVIINAAECNYVAGILAYSSAASTITNSYNEADICGKQYVAGIVAYAANGLQLSNCGNSGNITGTSTYIGGICAYTVTGTNTALDRVFNTGTITTSTNYIGGIAGRSDATQISNAFNQGIIAGTGTTSIGGIAGYVTAAGTIINAYNTGSIITNNEGYIANVISGNGLGVITNSYVTESAYDSAGVEVKTEDEFASGEVAWLLGEAFGQEIGTDLYPVTGGQSVYQLSDNLSVDTQYTNASLPDMEKPGYTCTLFELPSGNGFSGDTATSDLYALYVTTGYSQPTGNEIVLNLTRPVNPESFDFTHKGYWKDSYNYEDYLFLEFNDGDASRVIAFTHNIGGYYWDGMFGNNYFDGFTYSINADSTNQTNWVANQWGCMAGGGIKTDADGNVLTGEDGVVLVDKGIPYLMAYGDAMNMDAYYIDELGFGTLQTLFYDEYDAVGVYINNHPWAYYGNIAGNGMSRGLTKEGDYYKLIIHALNADGEKTGKSVEHMLAEYTSGEGLIQSKNWEWVDLSPLGKIGGLYYTLESTDMASGYMNTAAYFCLDKLTVKVADTTTEINASGKDADFSVYPNPFKEYIIVTLPEGRQLSIYNMSGQCVYEQELPAGANKINVAGLSRGIYTVKYGNGSVKVIK